MSDVHIKLPKPHPSPDDQIVVDGHNIATSVTGFSLQAGVRRNPRLELELLVNDVTRFESPHVEVLLDSSTAAFLERAGWTPPPGVASVLDRDEHGCPCEWIDISPWRTDPDSPETTLGRTVPTCPVHGST